MQSDNLDILKDLTICVPVRDRQVNLVKILDYYKGTDCKKIIFDTSRQAYGDDDLVKEAGFDYVYWGPTSYFEKWQKILSIVDTKYLIDCPDDDIALITSLPLCVEFLNENEDYSACSGIELGFNTKSVYPIPPTQNYINQIFYDYKSDDVYSRIEHFLIKNPVSMWHGVLRTQVAKDYWDMINSEKEVQYLGYLEFMHLVHVATAGNIKVLPAIFRMRNYRGDKHSHRVHQTGNASQELEITKQLINNVNFNHFLPMISEIRKHDISKSPGKSFEFLERVLSQHNTTVVQKMSVWPMGGWWKKGRDIPSFAPEGYRAKEIVDQKEDLDRFASAWCRDPVYKSSELYFEENAPLTMTPPKKKKDTPLAANGVRQDKK